jgi:hypothetical protein
MPTLFEDEDVVLFLLRRRRLTDGGADFIISNTSFVRCRLLGPIHLRLDDDVLVEDCTFTPSKPKCVKGLEAEREYVGAFRVSGCSFTDCEFDDVKVIVAPDHELVARKRKPAEALSPS